MLINDFSLKMLKTSMEIAREEIDCGYYFP